METVRLLLEKGADINSSNDFGSTILILAAFIFDESSEIVKLLLENGANVNLTNKDGETALIAALYSDNVETVKLLLENGADVSLINKENKTFFDHVPIKYLQECLDIVYQIEHHKLSMKKLLKPINKRSIE